MTFRDQPFSGVQLLANIVWYRSKATLRGIYGRGYPNTPKNSRQPRSFPPEIVEIIIAHLAYDTPALKACAATCFTWYNVVVPHLYHTVLLRERVGRGKTRRCPLPSLYKLELLPFAKELQIRKPVYTVPWINPVIYDPRNMQYFRAMANLQELKIVYLNLPGFPARLDEYFGHFSHTLRSLALEGPRGTRRQLLGFFKLFPKLDDMEIRHYHAVQEEHEVSDNQLVPINEGLRGRLVLYAFHEGGLLQDIVAAFGGMRFTSMDLRYVQGARFLLEACAHTLKTVRLYPGDALDPCEDVFIP